MRVVTAKGGSGTIAWIAWLRALLTAGVGLAVVACSFIDDYSHFHVRSDAGASDGRTGSDSGQDCGTGETLCASGCVSLASSRGNCGECEWACEAGQHCVDSECEDECPYEVCVVGASEECIDTSTAVPHCGACGRACSTTHAVPTCVDGSCELACETGYDDCDGDVSTGCERALDVPAHCGACGSACLEGVGCVGAAVCGDRPVEIDVGESHACVRNAAGDVLCWGHGEALGIASPLARLRDAGPASAISVGGNESCAVLASGVRCWSAWSPTVVAWDHDLTGVLSLESGGVTLSGFFPSPASSHCALRSAGDELLCWGWNHDGMFGVPGGVASVPTAPAGWTPVSDVGVGSNHVCEVTRSGGVRCRGGNSEHQLASEGPGGEDTVEVVLPAPAARVAAGPGPIVGSRYDGHSVVLLDDGRVLAWGLGSPDPSLVDVPGTVLDVDAGTGFTCAHVTSGSVGEVWCWGRNGRGQLGDGTMDASAAPVRAAVLGDVSQLAVGNHHSCALERGGGVRCWGDGRREGLGAPRPFDPVSSISGVAELSLGQGGPDGNHSCLRYAAGQVRCWGDNGAGQLGRAPSADAHLPEPPLLGRFTRIAAGHRFTCAVLVDGTVRCWGDNSDGQLGTDTEGREVELADRGGERLGRVLELAAGAAHVCALVVPDLVLGRVTPEVYCWGRNMHRQLGVEDPAPGGAVRAGGSLSARMVAAGDRFTCVIDALSKVWCWGDESDWRLGVPPGDPPVGRPTPQPVMEIESAKRIASGLQHTCVIDGDDQVWCWGSNGVVFPSEGVGRVDPASGAPSLPPTHVDLDLAPGETPVELAIGALASCVLTDGGRVLCWGGDERRQLGRGSGTHERTPGEVPGLVAAHLAVGSTQACATTPASDVVCWGWNQSGELGYGDTTTRNAPGPPLGLGAR